MTRLRVALICCTILSGGCVDTSVVLHVWPDGHGRAVMTTRVYEAGLHAFDGLFPAQSPPRSLEEELPPPDEGTVLEFFGGRRLKLASSQFHKTNDGAVRTTIAEFSDVTELKVPFPPTFGLGATSHISIGGVVDEPRMSFALRPHENGDRLLVVKLPDGRVDADPDLQMTVFKTDSPEERAIKTAIKKMAVHFKVQLEDAPLLRTNAPASSGNSVTVLDLDLDKIINNLNENKVRQAISPASMQEILWQLGDMPGAVLPTEHEVFLEFEVPRQQAPAQPPAQAQGVASPPDTEIYLAPLKVSGAAIEVGEAINITNSPGYDNQPSFTPDGRAILFTSVRGPSPGVPGGSPTQTDIYRYDIAARQTSRVTQTPESEYSPTVMLDGTRMSVIRVEADGTQRLWSIAPSGPKIQVDVLLPDVKPVGYHAWADEQTLALFVLGPPATLQLADVRTGQLRAIATDIGRSLQRMPGPATTRDVSFVQRERTADSTKLVIKKLNARTGEVTVLTPAVDGATEADTAWTPDSTLLMAHEGTLYAWRQGQSGWKAVANLQKLSLKGVTRLAVSPKGDFLALVGSPR